jgi:hypothetical protein
MCINAVAQQYLQAGLSVLPANVPLKCVALHRWKDYQSRLPTEDEVQTWFSNGHTGICIITGSVSGNLELIDFDMAAEMFEPWRQVIEKSLPDVFASLVIERSQSGGCHVIYRCQREICKSIKLARRKIHVLNGDEFVLCGKKFKPICDKDGTWYILPTYIETRGQGGLFLCAPTPGYELIQNSFTNIPTISAGQRDILLEAALSLNEYVPEPVQPSQPITVPSGTLRPGDDYNATGDVRSVLQAHGWKCIQGGENEHWCRPGKTTGTSATLKNRIFYVFSSNAHPFDSEKAYSSFSVYTLLEHNGDYSIAAAVLGKEGFGEKTLPQNTDVDITALIPKPSAMMQEYKPFPTETLPEPIRSYILAAAESLNCDPAYIALPALATIASCIGNTARILLKRDWKEPPVLWTAIISESGTMKSPAFKMAVNILKTIQYKALTQYEAAMQAHAKSVEEYDIALAHAKISKNNDELPEKPQEPAAQRFWVSDVTSEAIAPILINNPKGVLCAVDELATWVRGFDRYVSGGKGADVARWLSMYDADSILIDRKTQQQRIISVPSAAVSLAGTIQPGVFLDCFKQKSLRESGLLARILIAMPPARPAFWSESEIPEDVQLSYEGILAGLIEWQPVVDDNHIVNPHYIGMSHKAKERFIRFVDEHADEAVELSGDLSAAWSKLKGATARLALIFECIKTIAANPYATPLDVKVGVESVESAITLVNWFKLEAARIYESFNEDEGCEKFGTIIDYIEKKGGAVTARDLMRGGPCLKDTGQAQRVLNEMISEGLGRWRYKEMTKRGGKPKAEFVLVKSY